MESPLRLSHNLNTAYLHNHRTITAQNNTQTKLQKHKASHSLLCKSADWNTWISHRKRKRLKVFSTQTSNYLSFRNRLDSEFGEQMSNCHEGNRCFSSRTACTNGWSVHTCHSISPTGSQSLNWTLTHLYGYKFKLGYSGHMLRHKLYRQLREFVSVYWREGNQCNLTISGTCI